MINFENLFIEAICFLFLGAPLAAGIVTTFESAEMEYSISGRRWALIYAVNTTTIFVFNILLVLGFGALGQLANSTNKDYVIFSNPAKAAILILISEIAVIVGAVFLKKLIKGSLNILPQNERNVNMLGKFIRERREALGLSCSELARRSDHPVSSIHGIENGKNKNPRFQIIIDIADVLEVSLEEMEKAFENEQDGE